MSIRTIGELRKVMESMSRLPAKTPIKAATLYYGELPIENVVVDVAKVIQDRRDGPH